MNYTGQEVNKFISKRRAPIAALLAEANRCGCKGCVGVPMNAEATRKMKEQIDQFNKESTGFVFIHKVQLKWHNQVLLVNWWT